MRLREGACMTEIDGVVAIVAVVVVKSEMAER
jgi:hypothetical protein